jgi:hypothetical protein
LKLAYQKSVKAYVDLTGQELLVLYYEALFGSQYLDFNDAIVVPLLGGALVLR